MSVLNIVKTFKIIKDLSDFSSIFPGPTHNDSNEEIGIQTFGSSQRTRQAWSNWQGESHWVTYRNLDIQ